MKTTLHGKWSENRLYPEFGPIITKHADNGHAKSEDELFANNVDPDTVMLVGPF